MSKMGGGTSGYFGNIRERGAEITDNGHAPGCGSFYELISKVLLIIFHRGLLEEVVSHLTYL